MNPPRVAVAAPPVAERLARIAERALRVVGDPRAGMGLLLLVAAANVAATLLPASRGMLDGWPYATLLGLTALSGVATVAVRAPSAWREWRRPGPVQPRGALSATLPARERDEVAMRLRDAGYRIRQERSRGAWAVHGVRRGWSRLAGVVSHLSIVVVVIGIAIGAAFGSETTFSLLPGEQALLDAPRAGFSSAVRFDGLDAAFGEEGRPERLDTAVSFLRDGETVDSAVVRVNEPGDFDGYLVHAWTYGPAVHLRVTTLGGSVLLDDAIPLDGQRDGTPVGSAALPTAGVTLGLALVDADANRLGVSAIGSDGLLDTAQLTPGDAVRVGDVAVELRGFDAWVTFLSRRDPGLLILFGGTGLLSASLAVAFWLPRRRVTVRPMPAGAGILLALRGERFDRADDELARLARALAPT